MFKLIRQLFKKETVLKIDRFETLSRQIAGTGHPEYPFYDKIYSPSTRMPCADFTQWVVECINNQDSSSVFRLLCEFSDERLAETTVKTLWNWDFRNIIDADESVITEIKAIWLITNMRKMQKESLLGIILFNSLFGCHLRIAPDSWNSILRELGQFKKRTERHYITDRLSKNMLDYPQYPDDNPFVEWLPQIPVSARQHFWGALTYFFSRGKTVVMLQDCTDYTLREYGINTIETTQILIESGAFEPPSSFTQLGKEINKDEISNIFNIAGIEFKKSWKREKLLNLENQTLVPLIQNYAKNAGLYSLKPEYSVFAKELYDCRENSRPLFDALCVL